MTIKKRGMDTEQESLKGGEDLPLRMITGEEGVMGILTPLILENLEKERTEDQVGHSPQDGKDADPQMKDFLEKPMILGIEVDEKTGLIKVVENLNRDLVISVELCPVVRDKSMSNETNLMIPVTKEVVPQDLKYVVEG